MFQNNQKTIANFGQDNNQIASNVKDLAGNVRELTQWISELQTEIKGLNKRIDLRDDLVKELLKCKLITSLDKVLNEQTVNSLQREFAPDMQPKDLTVSTLATYEIGSQSTPVDPDSL